MARERILVKDAMYRVKDVIISFLSPITSLTTTKELNKENIPNSDINVLSFALRFLSETKKLSSLLTEIASTLVSIQSIGRKTLNNITVMGIENDEYCFKNKELEGSWLNLVLLHKYINEKNPTLDLDEFYDLILYPTSRVIEALSIYRHYYKPDILFEEAKKSIIMGLKFILNSIAKIPIVEICYDISMCVPIAKAMDRLTKHVKFNEEISKVITELKLYTKENDPDMELIYSQDVYYSALKSEYEANGLKINDKELIPLYNNLKSDIYGKILKGIEFLTEFKAPVPNFVNEKLLPMTSKYFKAIFKVANGEHFLKYYSNLAESAYSILLRANNRAFAESVLNLLTESSSWIYNKSLNIRELVKIILGSGLLVLSRGALRK